MSGAVAWAVSAAFQNYHRLPTEGNHTEQAYSNPDQLPKSTEKHEDDAGEIGLSRYF